MPLTTKPVDATTLQQRAAAHATQIRRLQRQIADLEQGGATAEQLQQSRGVERALQDELARVLGHPDYPRTDDVRVPPQPPGA